METAALIPALKVAYPPELPVSQRKDEIAAAIRDHQVVVVAGETGSGKTTQLPKICLELGRGVNGQIGHTQPRRIAARTVAGRIAEELGTELGAAEQHTCRSGIQVIEPGPVLEPGQAAVGGNRHRADPAERPAGHLFQVHLICHSTHASTALPWKLAGRKSVR